VRAYCCDPDRLEASCDFHGWRNRDLKILINSPYPAMRAALVKMIQYFARRTVKSTTLLALIRYSLLHPIDKKGDRTALRPACSGVLLFQCG